VTDGPVLIGGSDQPVVVTATKRCQAPGFVAAEHHWLVIRPRIGGIVAIRITG
jgi:hypothetical protein